MAYPCLPRLSASNPSHTSRALPSLPVLTVAEITYAGLSFPAIPLLTPPTATRLTDPAAPQPAYHSSRVLCIPLLPNISAPHRPCPSHSSPATPIRTKPIPVFPPRALPCLPFLSTPFSSLSRLASPAMRPRVMSFHVTPRLPLRSIALAVCPFNAIPFLPFHSLPSHCYRAANLRADPASPRLAAPCPAPPQRPRPCLPFQHAHFHTATLVS